MIIWLLRDSQVADIHCLVRCYNFSPIEYLWDMIGRILGHLPGLIMDMQRL